MVFFAPVDCLFSSHWNSIIKIHKKKFKIIHFILLLKTQICSIKLLSSKLEQILWDPRRTVSQRRFSWVSTTFVLDQEIGGCLGCPQHLFWLIENNQNVTFIEKSFRNVIIFSLNMTSSGCWTTYKLYILVFIVFTVSLCK